MNTCQHIYISTEGTRGLIRENKKFELMLTRCAKAYSSSCSQIVIVYLQPFCCNSLLKCAPQPKITKINKTPYFGNSGSFKVIDVDMTKNFSLLLVVINSMPMPICNCFHERLVNNGKITTFTGCLLYTSPSPRDRQKSRMPSSA